MNKALSMFLILLSILILLLAGCGTEEVDTPLPAPQTSPAGDVSDTTTPNAPDSNTNTDTPPPPDDSSEPSEPDGELTFMDCGEPEGSADLEVQFDGTDLFIDWGDTNAIGVYVTEPDATLPQGPGETIGGTAYWVLEMQQFPTGFAGPVTYGDVPEGADEATLKHGGDEGGAALDEGICYKVSVTTTTFQVGSVFIGWEYR